MTPLTALRAVAAHERSAVYALTHTPPALPAGIRTVEVAVTDGLPVGVVSARVDRAGTTPVLVAARSRVEDYEDEHGTFHVATCTCGWRGREWADPDEADLARLAHDDIHRVQDAERALHLRRGAR